MAEQVRENQVSTTFAIVSKTEPGVLYGEGTFPDGASAEETAHNLNALLSVEARVYRAVEHSVTDSLVVVGEESEYAAAPVRAAVQDTQVAAPSEQPTAEPTQDAAPSQQPATEEPVGPQPSHEPVQSPEPANPTTSSSIPVPIPRPHDDSEQAEDSSGEPGQPGEIPADPFARR